MQKTPKQAFPIVCFPRHYTVTVADLVIPADAVQYDGKSEIT